MFLMALMLMLHSILLLLFRRSVVSCGVSKKLYMEERKKSRAPISASREVDKYPGLLLDIIFTN